MTVSSIVPVNNYIGNGSNDKFDFDFLIENENELVVTHISNNKIKTVLKNGIDYSIHEIGNKNGSYITFPILGSSFNKLQTDETISLSLDLEIKQESEFENSSHLNLNLLEWTFDYIIRILQILCRKVERSVKVQEGLNFDTDELAANINTVSENINNVNTVSASCSNINLLSPYVSNINAVANDLANIDSASTNATHAAIWAEGTDEQVQSIGGTHSAKNWAIISEQVDTDLSNISNAGINFIKHSKALMTDAISDNTFVYNDILKYNHSTYDDSKFTVIGTPNITADGIANDFSGSNRIKKVFDYNGNTLEICNGFYFKTDNDGANIFEARNNSNVAIVRNYLSPSNNIILFGVSGENLLISSTDYNPSENDFIITKALINNDKTITFIVVNKTKNIIISKTSTGTITNEPSAIGNTLYIGNANGNEWYSGLIDLKYTSIRIDNIEIFNGNKTGLDIIQPDDYTVNGSLTITNDGIASGFGDTTNYIKTAVFSPGTKPWKIYRGFTTANIAGVAQRIYCSRSFGVNLFIGSDKHFALQLSANGTSTDIGTLSGNHLVQPYKHYILCAEFTGTEYKLSYSTDEGNTFIADSSLQSTTTVIDGSSAGGQLGTNTWYVNVEFKGNIDLNECRDYIGGNLVYQPCLKIPYNISKTGSKVVDVYARNRIQSMYEQYGYAPYYTIDEANQNFTLPMGEMYGMMLNKSTPHILETYKNGTSWYRIWSDGWCEQGGYEGFHNSDVIINFLKTYKDLNYNLSGTSATEGQINIGLIKIDETSFKYHIGNNVTSGFWQASGYIY